jgi:hypothetical protein
LRLAKHKTLAENLQFIGGNISIPRGNMAAQSRNEIPEVTLVCEYRRLAANDLEPCLLDNRRHFIGAQSITDCACFRRKLFNIAANLPGTLRSWCAALKQRERL